MITDVFSTSGQLGITRTAKMKRDTSATPVGVLGIDFELSGLANILTDALSRTVNSWAFVVERSGDSAGLLLGSSFGAPLRDGTGQRCYAHGTNCPIQSETIAATARHFHAGGWYETEPGKVLTNTVPGNASWVGLRCVAPLSALRNHLIHLMRSLMPCRCTALLPVVIPSRYRALTLAVAPAALWSTRRYEAVSKGFTTGGLDWLLVVGQDIV